MNMGPKVGLVKFFDVVKIEPLLESNGAITLLDNMKSYIIIFQKKWLAIFSEKKVH